MIDPVELGKRFPQAVVPLHGLPLTIINHRGPQLASTFWQQRGRRQGIDIQI